MSALKFIQILINYKIQVKVCLIKASETYFTDTILGMPEHDFLNQNKAVN